jgi:sulfofructose kinase
MQNKTVQVYGLGQCCIDYIAKVDTFPAVDTKCEFQEMVIQGGGPVATALVALSKWGISCAFSGIVGDDLFGKLIVESLNKEEVDISGLLVRGGSNSQFAFILAEAGSGSRTVFWRKPTGPPPTDAEIDNNVIEKAQIVHTDGLFIDATLAACRVAKDAGKKVVVDAGSLRDGMLKLASISDYFIASEKFAAEYVGKGKALQACNELLKLGPKMAAVTLGSRGYLAVHQGKVLKKPAYKVKAVDTTGCGDIFHAGFIYGLIKKWKVEESLDFAAWAAAQTSLKLGGQEGIPSLEGWKVV